jgi:hypothetical protein
MVDIDKEGFIKVIPRQKELKDYLFYLTFNNRAEITYYENPIELKGKLHNKNKITYDKGNLNLFYSYLESTKKEFKGHKIKALELIMSYSTDFNKLMIEIYGLEKWKTIYINIISKLLHKHFKDNKTFLSYTHTFDSQGIRIHNHTLMYPYKFNKKEQIFELYTYIPDENLNLLKKDYNTISKQLIQKNATQINHLKKKKKHQKYLKRFKI